MASLVKKKKGHRLYYYLVESARVDGKPRIVHQAYLGTAEKLAELVQQKSAPVPLSATLRDFGLPGALWLAAKQSGVWPLLESLWPSPRSGPGPAHYLLLAAIHRICDPGPKTEVSNWYERTILASEWGFPAERFTSQAFWDAFEQILPETSETLAPAEDPLDHAQLRLLGLWKEKQLVGRRLLAYDTTNFYTYIASTNTRNHLAQRGHNKQGRHNLRQVGLSYVLDGESGLSLCHHVYPGNVADVEGFSVALVSTHRASARSKPDGPRHRHTGLRQGHGRTGQHCATGRSRGGMDFCPAVESSTGGVARARHRRAAAVQRGTAGGAGGRRATAHPDHQHQPRAAVPATLLEGIE